MLRHDAVLFDLDGTLLDSVALILASYHHTLAAHALPPRTDEEILAGLGMTLEAQFERWVEPSLVPRLSLTYREHNLAVHDAMVRPYPGVSQVVRDLHSAGARLAIVTSKRRDGTLKGLDALGLRDAFEVLVCADDVTRGKPDPEPVIRATTALGVELHRTIFVGDSTHDMEAGHAAGVQTAAVLWGPYTRGALEPTKPGAWIENADELRALLLPGA